ncbi:hypothetical protein ACHAO1_010755 [Botrytis cinerea]
MFSISHALAATDAVKLSIENAIQNGDFVTNHAEEVESRAAKHKALKTLDQAVEVVDSTLAKLRKNVAKRHGTTPVATTFRASKVSAPTKFFGRTATAAASSNDKVKDMIKTMSAEKGDAGNPTLANSVPTLTEMANKTAPIIDNFDSVLFSAILNTVPVIGLKDQTIMYVNKTRNSIPLQPPIDQWAVFSSLPSGVTVGPDDKVHFFPYKGDFYMSIGKKVWYKKHREGVKGGIAGDPELAKAVDNWPYMYNNDWIHVGDQALPEDDLIAVMPYTVLSADHSAIEFHLILLNRDSTLQVLTGDSIKDTNEFANLSFKASQESASRPQWQLMTYWNDQLVGYDSEQNFWDLKPDFGGRSYTASDKTKLPEPISGLTATEQGPVAIRADGQLWKRLVEPPKKDDDPGSYSWKAWIKVDGVKNIGVASPGVLLDLNLLTSTLQSRYIETQTAVIPLMNKMRSFGMTHAVYLKSLNEAANTWINNPDDAAKQADAIKHGKGFVNHAMVWAKILGSAADSAKTPVNVMASQLKDVEAQLEILLTTLQTKLAGLKAALKVDEDYLSKLQAALWGSIAAMLLSIVVAVIGVTTMNPWVCAAAGALLAGGILGACLLATKMGEVAARISNTESQITTTQTAINELSTVVDSFQNISELYSTLNQFFGRMTLDAATLKDMDDATALQLGAEVLADTSSIDAAASMTEDITKACTAYLDVLSRQGIKLPTVEFAALNAVPHPVRLMAKARSTDDRFHDTVESAQAALSEGRHEDYFKTIQRAAVLHEASLSMEHFAQVSTGIWADIPALTNAGAMWAGLNKHLGANSSAIPLFVVSSSIAGANEVEGSLNECRPQVISLMRQTLQLAEVSQSWAEKYPTLPEDAQKPEAQKYQDEAIKACQAAENSSAKANNAFIDLNNKAQAFQRSLDSQIGARKGQINAANANANALKRNLSPPWYVYLGGLVTIGVWMATETAKINDQLNSTVDHLNSMISELTSAKSSGINFDGESLTWQDMVQNVSHDMFFIYNILTGVEGQLMEDPNLYASYIKVEWSQLAENANNVLTILGAHSPATLFTVQGSGLKKLRAVSRSTSTGDKKKLIASVSSSGKLGSTLATQSKQCQDAFKQINIVLGLPWIQDVVGYWDDTKTSKATLFDITANLKREYAHMIGMEYDTVQKLYSLSILQSARAQNVQNGKLPMNVFINYTLTSLCAALKSAQSTSQKFKDSAKDFENIVSIISKNIDDISSKIAGLDTKIDEANKTLRDKIIGEIADVIAIAFATGALLVALGVFGPVGAAVALGTKISATATLTAASIKLILDSLSIDDIVKTIEALKATRKDLQTSKENLTKVKPFFTNIAQGVDALTDTVTDMATTLQNVNDNIDIWKEVALTKDDVAEIQKSWDEVKDDCLVWMDMVHGQGINPVTMSVAI